MYLNKGQNLQMSAVVGWTLTWDVFKYLSQIIARFLKQSWTLTWDVFKFVHIKSMSVVYCVEL